MSRHCGCYLRVVYFILDRKYGPIQMYVLSSSAEQVLIYNVGLLPSKYYKVLGDKDLHGFLQLLVFSLGLIIAIALVCTHVVVCCSLTVQCIYCVYSSRHIRVFCLAISPVVFLFQVKASSKYISSVFFVCSRDKITRHLHDLYFRDVLYYHVNVTDAFVDNPYVFRDLHCSMLIDCASTFTLTYNDIYVLFLNK